MDDRVGKKGEGDESNERAQMNVDPGKPPKVAKAQKVRHLDSRRLGLLGPQSIPFLLAHSGYTASTQISQGLQSG